MNILSIITAAYNAEAFISHLIDSIVCQPVQVEYIIVNDGSTDNTKYICEEYIKKYKNIRLINTDNKGAGAARNIGIKAATGKYLIFVDSDDLLFNNVINDSLLNFLEQSAAQNIDIISTAIGSTDVNLINKPIIIQPQNSADIEGSLPWLEFWSFIYRRDFIIKNNIVFFEYQEQDVESAFRYRAFSKTSNIKVAPKYSYYLRRVNPTSNMHTLNYYKLFRIKSKIYAQLVDESIYNKRPKTETIRLQYTEIECIYCYFKYTWKNGHEDTPNYQVYYNEIKKLFLKRIKGAILYMNYRHLESICRYLYYILYIQCFLSFKIIEKKPAAQVVEHAKVPLQFDDESRIIERLAKWSQEVVFEKK